MNSVTQGQPPSEEKIDEIDRIILSIVSSNPMITNAEIGEQVGMSPSSALRRRQRLEETGVITGIAPSSTIRLLVMSIACWSK